jgi:hypothetical protein
MFKPVKKPGNYKLAWSQDPAIHLPADAKALAAELQIAQETQNWEPLIVDGMQPTWFLLQRLPRDPFVRWRDATAMGVFGPGESAIVLLRMALVGVDNFGDVKVGKPGSGVVGRVDLEMPIATTDIIDALHLALQDVGKSSDHLFGELARAINERENVTYPK